MSRKPTDPLDSLPVMVDVEQGNEFEAHNVLTLDLLPVDGTDETEVNSETEPSPEVGSIEPATEAEPTDSEESALDDAASTTVVRYVGNADVFEHEQFRFRRGTPVEVPSDVAVKLLAYRNERFEQVKE